MSSLWQPVGAIWLALQLAAGLACSPPPSAPPSADRSMAAPTPLPPQESPQYTAGYLLRTTLRLARPVRFVLLTPPEQLAYRALERESHLVTRLETAPSGALLMPDPRSPMGGWSFHLAGNRILSVSPQGSVGLHRRTQLPDLLDLATEDAPRHAVEEHTAVFTFRLAEKPLERSLSDGLHLDLPLTMGSGNRKRRIRVRLDLTFPTDGRHEPLCTLLPRHALGAHLVPLAPWPAAASLISRINCSSERPTRAVLTVDAEDASGAPPSFITTVHRARKRQSPRPAGTPTGSDGRLPRVKVPGRQVVSVSRLSGMRKGNGQSTLKVENRGRRAAMVYLDGIYIGWVAPKESMRFRTPTPGFYRIYATTPSGAFYWGPRDTYLPGDFSLTP